MASPPTWDRCFSRKKIAVFEHLIPDAYEAIEDVTNCVVDDWPSRIECMTRTEIAEGGEDGTGHGLYFVDEERIKVNASMPAWSIFGNFVHENIHHVDPSLSERRVDQLTHNVLGRLGVLANTEPSVRNPDGDGLPLLKITEEGHVFETNRPVEFDFLRGTQKAPYFGAQYQQDIEPAGRYMLLRGPWATKKPAPGMEYGHIRFERPLVLAFNSDPKAESLYNETSWKAHLSRVYRKKGRALSRALGRHYDGIVTVWLDERGRPRDTREIVDLSAFV